MDIPDEVVVLDGDRERIRLEARWGNALLGGNGQDGDLFVFRRGATGREVDHASIHLNGDRGDIRYDGALVGSYFPRPNYDSGWRQIAPGQQITLEHNIQEQQQRYRGRDVSADQYVVDLQFRYGRHSAIHARHLGAIFWERRDDRNVIDATGGAGAYWDNLTDNAVDVLRDPGDTAVNWFRVRIWVYV